MKTAIIKQILPPIEEPVREVSNETGIHTATIYLWKRHAAEGILDLGDDVVRPRDRSPGEKMTLLLVNKSIEKD